MIRSHFRQQRIFAVTIVGLLCSLCSYAQQNQLPLIPYPNKVVPGRGNFTFTPQTVVAGNDFFSNEKLVLAELFSKSFGKPLPVKKDYPGIVQMNLDRRITDPEGYKLTITTQQITLQAADRAGMLIAIQTLRQLLPADIESAQGGKNKISVPAVAIEDQPAFSWRGTHLDVSRHFFTLDYLKRHIDLMALYKFNKFHLHLTDDQGWRVEIKKYPKLTEEGAWRTLNNQDSIVMSRSKENPDFIIDPRFFRQKNGREVYGGFYTQQELKDLVAYAAARNIEIIPEIDMPGHMMAAINSYMFLSCDSTSSFGKFFSTPICPCNPATLDFAKDIFTEIMDIFPSTYIHIGGDEVERSHWERSAACQDMMKREGMKTSAELQAWFINSMEKFFKEKGRKLIGWDEILDGGISSSAAIMYWRTWAGNAPNEAIKNGNVVIMSPDNPFYFSEQPDKNSLPATYNYSLIPASIAAKDRNRIIGGQANVWTEYVATEQRADYLYMPRMTALAENLWGSVKNYSSYMRRLDAHLVRLDTMKVAYRMPDLPLLYNYAFIDSMLVDVRSSMSNAQIRYTTDGSAPAQSSPVLNKLVLRTSQRLRMAAFKPDGRRGDIFDVAYNKQPLAQPAPDPAKPGKGLLVEWYNRSFDSTVLITGKPDREFTTAGVIVPKDAETAAFTMRYRGYINVPTSGIYTFYLTSDDAAVLKVAGREVANNDGMHAPKEKNGQVALQQGRQLFSLDFIEGGGGYTLRLLYSKDGSEPKEIPAEWFSNF
ncbi:family 20 glycosylhydrolase [Terrimonas sp. NA20]|uniref:beta-N-acetylhexosaminidase n=1 Tax=Terrimonas ginsenosidimutans TaxID=2908004 RepID=A0ABS9KM01_9BACT|nr:family 20 glycosylhydrolase [Terrimonas ginsenosidimutans]MCG2613339.1 family 20 glycosylhydrolase [Terrimonas ginsenosidimutans]